MLKEGFELLKKYSIPVVDYWVNEIPKNLEFPVVVKVDLLHKTDYNAVRLNIKDHKELEETIKEFRKKFPEKDIIIQKQLMGDYREIIIGAKRDPVFDYFILIGIGGIYTELIKDFAIIIPPFDKEDFYRAIDSLKLKKILLGFRNKPPINLELLYNIVDNFSKIMENEKNIKEIEVNPFMINEKEGYAVDVRIIY